MIYTVDTLYVQDLDMQILHTVGLAITTLFFIHIYVNVCYKRFTSKYYKWV